VTRDEVIAILRRENPRKPLEQLTMYADAFADYQTAQANIGEHGSIVFHPRTGAPISNPYLSIRSAAAAAMTRLKLKADPLWAAAREAD
jgi:phage terminase small subunit